MAHETPSDRGGDHDSNTLTDRFDTGTADGDAIESLVPADYDASQRAALFDAVAITDTTDGAPASECVLVIDTRAGESVAYDVATTVLRVGDADVDPNAALGGPDFAAYTDTEPGHYLKWEVAGQSRKHDAATKTYGWWYGPSGEAYDSVTIERKDAVAAANWRADQ